MQSQPSKRVITKLVNEIIVSLFSYGAGLYSDMHTFEQYTYWNEYVIIAVNRNLSNCEKARKKGFRGFNGIRTRGLCVSAAVLYQPELWRPIHWRPANLLSSSTRERNETQNEMMWTAEIQMKWVRDHSSESQFKQLRKSPKKRISGLQRVFVFPQFTSFHSVFHFFHGLMNSINWPASSVWVFIAQAGRALQR